jgi:hypothetical protein
MNKILIVFLWFIAGMCVVLGAFFIANVTSQNNPIIFTYKIKSISHETYLSGNTYTIVMFDIQSLFGSPTGVKIVGYYDLTIGKTYSIEIGPDVGYAFEVVSIKEVVDK